MEATEGVVLTAPADIAIAVPGLWKNARAAKWALKKLGARARGGTEDSFPTYKGSYVGKMSSVPSHALQYQRAGAKQKFYWAYFDPRQWPVARVWYGARGWVVKLREYLWPGELPPMAGAGKVVIVDRLVQVLRRARYVLSADYKQHKIYTGTGRPGRYVFSKDPQAIAAYDGSPGGERASNVFELRTKRLLCYVRAAAIKRESNCFQVPSERRGRGYPPLGSSDGARSVEVVRAGVVFLVRCTFPCVPPPQ
jgi:hypothetical protein